MQHNAVKSLVFTMMVLVAWSATACDAKHIANSVHNAIRRDIYQDKSQDDEQLLLAQELDFSLDDSDKEYHLEFENLNTNKPQKQKLTEVPPKPKQENKPHQKPTQSNKEKPQPIKPVKPENDNQQTLSNEPKAPTPEQPTPTSDNMFTIAKSHVKKYFDNLWDPKQDIQTNALAVLNNLKDGITEAFSADPVNEHVDIEAVNQYIY